MYKNIGNSFIFDNKIQSNEYFEFELNSNSIIYEVIRVINQNIVFLDEHLERLKESMESLSVDTSVVNLIKNDILLLVKKHKGFNKNIKIDVYERNDKYHYRVYFVESFYPKQEVYDRGVLTTVSHIVRNSPHIKILNMDYKKHIQELKGNTFFEVLLANDEGYVTEGSRSNLVFVKNNTLYSSPLEEILEGITFKKVLMMAKDKGYKIKYESVHIDKIHEYDACFLTGTSLGVLPISSIDEIKFGSSTNLLVLELIEAYNKNVGNFKKRR